MGCLDLLVTLGICPEDEGASLSGLTLVEAGGMNLKNFANIAPDSSGMDMAQEKIDLAIKLVRNDFISALAASNVITIVTNPEYNSAYFDTGLTISASSEARGAIIHKSSAHRGGLRTTTIERIEIYPYQSGSGTLKIIDGNNTYSYAIDFTANQVNVYNSTQLSDFPFEMIHDAVQILVEAPGVTFASGFIQCMQGCGGAPNPCAWVNGWDGSNYIKLESYGVNPVFKCQCDYDKILCSAPELIGNIVWLKAQILIFDEQYKSNRFHNWVVYNNEMINDVVMPDLVGQYNERWKALMGNLPSILRTFRDSCIQCNAARWVVNE
jgi:hypothetical protein